MDKATVDLLRPDLIDLLKKGEPAKFSVPPNLELHAKQISCVAKGIKTSNGSFTIELTLVSFPAALTLTGSGSATAAPGPDHAYFGPFHESLIEIPKESNQDLDLNDLEVMRLDFKGEHAHSSMILASKALPVTGPVPLVKPEVFDLLKRGKPAKFRILPANRDATIERNPFAGKADVRLTHIACTPIGIKTSNNIFTIHLTHPGTETFIDETGRELALHHNPMSVTLTGTSSAEVAFDQDHTLIGPFCEWMVEIPETYNRGLDLTGLESIQFDFKGRFRTPRWGKEENADEGAVAGAGG